MGDFYANLVAKLSGYFRTANDMAHNLEPPSATDLSHIHSTAATTWDDAHLALEQELAANLERQEQLLSLLAGELNPDVRGEGIATEHVLKNTKSNGSLYDMTRFPWGGQVMRSNGDGRKHDA